mgnify:CR=1 FL=1
MNNPYDYGVRDSEGYTKEYRRIIMGGGLISLLLIMGGLSALFYFNAKNNRANQNYYQNPLEIKASTNSKDNPLSVSNIDYSVQRGKIK